MCLSLLLNYILLIPLKIIVNPFFVPSIKYIFEIQM